MQNEDSLIGYRDGTSSELKVIRELFGIPQASRNHHLYTIGQTGTGKSTLLRNLILQDMEAGRGVVVIDPHGDLVQELLDLVPTHRTNDTFLIDPSDFDNPFGINFFARKSEDPQRRDLTSNQAISVFRHLFKLDEENQPRLLYLLKNTVSALIEAPNTSILSIKHMIVDGEYREKVLAHVTDEEVLSYWYDEFLQYDKRDQQNIVASTLNKAGVVNSSPTLRNMLGQRNPRFDFGKAMEHGNVVLCDLSKGRLGEGGGRFLGAMILIQLYVAALERADVPEARRTPCHLYVDEFQNFGTSSVFADMLSESRKYGLKLTLAHQFMYQVDTLLRESIIGNIGNIISFRVGSSDAEVLADEYAEMGRPVSPNAFTDLAAHEIFIRMHAGGQRLTPYFAKTRAPQGTQTKQRNTIVERTRRAYTKPLADVQKGLRKEVGEIENAPA